MKITMTGCEHRKYTIAKRVHAVATCLSCYRRVTTSADQMSLVDAPPPPPCNHATKTPVSQAITRGRPYHDAVCVDCGVVLRHPDGRGKWDEVRFYGYLIREMP